MDEKTQAEFARRLEAAFGQVVNVVTELNLKQLEPHIDRLIGLLREARELLDDTEEWQPDWAAAKIVGLVERIDDELAKE